MTTPIATQLRDYRDKLTVWVKRKGLEGGGGNWIPAARIYTKLPEPNQPQNLSVFEKKAFDAVRAEVLKKAAV